jgi:hypothetical protein
VPSNSDRRVVIRSIETGIAAYAESRRRRITPFVDKHFSFRGAWKLNKLALGRDLYRAPANLFWAPIYFITKVGGAAFNRIGLTSVSGKIAQLPSGFRTDVEREVEWLLFSEFLELPYALNTRVTEKNSLVEYILTDSELARLFETALQPLSKANENSHVRLQLEKKLTTYIDNRKDVAELTSALIAAAGALAVKKGLGGGTIALGQAAAAAAAQASAVSTFWLGPTLGSLYYSVFPAAVSIGLLVGATTGVAAVLGLVSAVAGVLADPAQRALGLHQKKLLRLVDALENQLSGSGSEAYELRDGLIARLLDLVDVLRSVAPVRG